MRIAMAFFLSLTTLPIAPSIALASPAMASPVAPATAESTRTSFRGTIDARGSMGAGKRFQRSFEINIDYDIQPQPKAKASVKERRICKNEPWEFQTRCETKCVTSIEFELGTVTVAVNPLVQAADDTAEEASVASVTKPIFARLEKHDPFDGEKDCQVAKIHGLQVVSSEVNVMFETADDSSLWLSLDHHAGETEVMDRVFQAPLREIAPDTYEITNGSPSQSTSLFWQYIEAANWGVVGETSLQRK